MKRILIISTVGLIYDGITSIITSYLEAMDLSNLDVRVVGTIKVEPSIKKKIERCGCKIVGLPDRRKETLKYFLALWEYIRKEKIEVIHAHGNSGTLAVEMLAGYLGRAKKRIAHSHNTNCEQIKTDRILRPLFNILYTDALACGEEAGKWLFGNRPFRILTNGRDVEKYKFNLVMRDKMRKQYGLIDEFVIGHVGGFYRQKNHVFLIEIFREVLKQKPDAMLFLIGDGPMKESIEKSAEDIKRNIVFVGITDHVEDYLNMMDAMVLPSLFEGLPLVVIEWQINGLPCLISDVVTKDCEQTDMVYWLSLMESSQKWASVICEIVDISNRKKLGIIGNRVIANSIYNIKFSADNLKKIYED